jgi:hypothetical protein
LHFVHKHGKASDTKDHDEPEEFIQLAEEVEEKQTESISHHELETPQEFTDGRKPASCQQTTLSKEPEIREEATNHSENSAWELSAKEHDDVETSDANRAGRFRGESPPMERLPPDGAPLEEPVPCDDFTIFPDFETIGLKA